MPTIDQPKLTKLARRGSRAFPAAEGMGGFEYVIRMAASADGVASWGSDWRSRDQQLRAFVADEPWVAATVSSLAARNSAYSWSLEGPPRTVARLQDMLQEADYGRGWVHMLNKLSSDLYCLGPRSTVHLGGDRRGKKKTIQAMVQDQDQGPVICLDKNGNLTERRVTGWYANPLGDRQWVWLSLRDTNHHARGNPGGLWLTNDHKVLTPDRGWVRADELRQGDNVVTGHPKPSPMQAQVLAGTLLGDGGLRQLHGNSSTLINTTHCKAQEEWLLLKRQAFAGFGWTPVNSDSKGRQVNMHSHSSAGLADWYKAWYPDGKKRIARGKVEANFSPLMLATWYMDDGSLQKNKTRKGDSTRPGLHLFTNGFEQDDVEWLAELLTRYGFSASVYSIPRQAASGRDKYYYLWLGAEAAERFFATVAPYVPSTMRYKLPDGLAPFDASLWQGFTTEAYMDTVEQVELKPLTTGYRGLVRTTYCIDVEETHNFMVSGMIVHNCQDNGAFLEIIRDGQGPMSPVIGLAHLDAGRVTRTGNPDVPYIYQDREGGMHRLAWYQCVDLTDFPSPVETHNGIQLCAVSRVLRIAQILRDVNIRKQEKLSGRFAGVLHIVSGIKRETIDNAFAQAQQESDNRGRRRYQPPVILGTVDPTAKVSKETIEIASLPDGWSEEEAMKWYIAVLALAFGCEYQDLAPLPGGGLGSSQQSTVLHLKARGKGPEHFQKMVEHRLNWYVLPSNVTFKFDEKDFEAEQIEAGVRKTRAEMYQLYNAVGMPSQVIYQIMQDNGDLKPEYLDILAEGDATPDTQAHDDEPLQPTEEQKLPDMETEQPQPAQEQQPPTGQQPQPPAPGAKGQAEDIRQQQIAVEAEKRPLEAEYEAEMQGALAEMRRAIVARMRAEVANA